MRVVLILVCEFYIGASNHFQFSIVIRRNSHNQFTSLVIVFHSTNHQISILYTFDFDFYNNSKILVFYVDIVNPVKVLIEMMFVFEGTFAVLAGKLSLDSALPALMLFQRTSCFVQLAASLANVARIVDYREICKANAGFLVSRRRAKNPNWESTGAKKKFLRVRNNENNATQVSIEKIRTST